MKKEQFYFLLAGFAFGVLVGFGLFQVYQDRPQLDAAANSAAIGSPGGPRAPGQGTPAQGAGAGGAAPMINEINELKRRLDANPNDAETAAALGRMYYEVGMWEQSLQFLDIALSAEPDDADLLTDAGNVHRQLGRFDRALENFLQAHKNNPEHWQSLFNTVVVAAFDLQQMDVADAAMARLDEIQPAPVELPALKQALAEFRAQGMAPSNAP